MTVYWQLNNYKLHKFLLIFYVTNEIIITPINYLNNFFIVQYIYSVNMLELISPYLSFILTISAVVGVLFPIFKWVYSVNLNIKNILKELTCNHGSSLKDKIIKLGDDYEARKQLINYIYSTQKWILSVSDKCFFECDELGNWTNVNEALEDKLNVSRGSLINSGWKNYIVLEDRNIVIPEWEKDIKTSTSVNIRCRFEVNNTQTEKVYLDMSIICEKINDNLWVGVLRDFNPALIDRNKNI